jgi:hypothetical protein
MIPINTQVLRVFILKCSCGIPVQEFFVLDMLKGTKTKGMLWNLGVEKDLLFLIQF